MALIRYHVAPNGDRFIVDVLGIVQCPHWGHVVTGVPSVNYAGRRYVVAEGFSRPIIVTSHTSVRLLCAVCDQQHSALTYCGWVYAEPGEALVERGEIVIPQLWPVFVRGCVGLARPIPGCVI